MLFEILNEVGIIALIAYLVKENPQYYTYIAVMMVPYALSKLGQKFKDFCAFLSGEVKYVIVMYCVGTMYKAMMCWCGRFGIGDSLYVCLMNCLGATLKNQTCKIIPA